MNPPSFCQVFFNFFEPRYVMLTRRIEEDGTKVYGYSDEYPPKVGGFGQVVDVAALESQTRSSRT